MSSPPENGTPSLPELTISAFPAWIVWFAGVVAAVQTIAGIAWFVTDSVLHSLTKPVAGFSFSHSARAEAMETKGVRLIEYCCDNRGPAEAGKYWLQIIVPDAYEGQKFTTGLKLSRSGGCDYVVKDDGGRTMIEVTPTSDRLGVGARFGVMITSGDPNWEATEVNLIGPDGTHESVKGRLPNPGVVNWWVYAIRNSAFVVTVITAVGAILLILIILWQFSKWTRAEVNRQIEIVRPIIDAIGYQKGVEDTIAKSRITDGAGDSNPFEEAILSKQKQNSGRDSGTKNKSGNNKKKPPDTPSDAH